MSSLILGTYPILNSKISNIDENGIETLSYAYTVKTDDSIYYTPGVDEEFYGLGNSSYPIDSVKPADFPDTSSSYLVTQVTSSQLSGGLTQLQINTMGTKNIDSPAKVSLLPNYPLIYGLSGSGGVDLSPDGLIGIAFNYLPKQKEAVINRITNGGVGVSVTFIDERGTEQQIHRTYFNSIMPASIKNTLLPVSNNPQNIFQSLYFGTGVILESRGFICKEFVYQTYGGVLLYRLLFAESGYAQAIRYYNAGDPPTITSIDREIFSV
jgi:hypothetical protein